MGVCFDAPPPFGPHALRFCAVSRAAASAGGA